MRPLLVSGYDVNNLFSTSIIFVSYFLVPLFSSSHKCNFVKLFCCWSYLTSLPLCVYLLLYEDQNKMWTAVDNIDAKYKLLAVKKKPISSLSFS